MFEHVRTLTAPCCGSAYWGHTDDGNQPAKLSSEIYAARTTKLFPTWTIQPPQGATSNLLLLVSWIIMVWINCWFCFSQSAVIWSDDDAFLCDVWIDLDGYDAGMWTLFGFLTKVFAKLCSTSSQFPAFGPADRNGCQLFVVHPTRVDVEILGRRKTRPLGLHCNLNANIDQLMYKQVILCL